MGNGPGPYHWARKFHQLADTTPHYISCNFMSVSRSARCIWVFGSNHHSTGATAPRRVH